MDAAGVHPGPELRGRARECAVLDGLLAAAREGHSATLVLQGEAGCGKTALLDYVRAQAGGFHIATARGVEVEMELPFAGLHQLCSPMLNRLDRLPDPQQHALQVAFGLRSAQAPDRFLIGLAVLGLLAEAAEEQPLACLIDDAQWLDQESMHALAFVGRRVIAEPIALVFARREPRDQYEALGLPEFSITGLTDRDARLVLASAIRGPLDEQVRDRLVAEAHGNPLALLELPRGLSPAELAGGFAVPGTRTVMARLGDTFMRRVRSLPDETQLVLLIAAAEPTGDVPLLWRAAERLAIRPDAAVPAETAGLLDLGARVQFRHPLLRSTVYEAAPTADRRAAHRALAEATDPGVDPDRRAWHRAHAASGPDEDVAADLERSAGRAQARGGLAAAAAFHARATALTVDPERRRQRALTAADAKLRVGAPEAALRLLAIADTGPHDDLQHARVDRLRAVIARSVDRGSEAPPLLLKAARQLEPLDPALARETYLDAMSAALFASRFATGGGVLEVSQAVQAASRPAEPQRPSDLLLDGLATRFTHGYVAGAPALRRTLHAFRKMGDDPTAEQRWLWLACWTAMDLWDDENWYALSTRLVRLARDSGALTVLPLALHLRAYLHLCAGEMLEGTSLIEEARAVTEATSSTLAPYSALLLAALQGRESDAADLTVAAIREILPRGEGFGVTVTEWASALLHNGLGHYDTALEAAQQATDHPDELAASTLTLAELVEAGARSGRPEAAADGARRLIEITRASGTDWAIGIEARCRALLHEGEAADNLYREAVRRLSRTRISVDLARAHLLYGEWLRRENRIGDARKQLHIAHEALETMGIEGFAERAAHELRATGETVRKRNVETFAQLTAQESQIAHYARDGMSNPEIGGRLFLSPRTVEWHMRKVFTKLDITSRKELRRVLPTPARPSAPA
jgi:DNA-binding CsgD family transcriptional regulator